jgi:hypothetical protein
MNRRRIAAAVLATCALAATPALAAPEHTTVIGVDKPKFEWTGAVQVSAGVPNGVRESIPCKTPVLRACEDVLFEVKDAGKLTIKVDGGPGGPPEDDVDLYVYKSDKDGTAGDQIHAGVAVGPDSASLKVVPGYYLAQVDYYRAKASGYTGVATFAGAVAAAPVPAVQAPAVSQPAPAAKPKPTAADRRKAKLRKCQKAAKKIKSSAKRKKALKRCSKAAKKR